MHRAKRCCGCGSRTVGESRKGTSSVGNLYPKTSEGQQTKRTQCVWNELQTVRNRDRLCKIAIALHRL
jgi:hypothetical protein